MTIEKITSLARPYALAAFEYALSQNNLPAWQAFLNAAALAAKDNAMQQLLHSPQLTREELGRLFSDVLSALLDNEKKNFICLLAEYERLALLPEIAALFNHYYEEHEKIIEVDVISAVSLEESYQKKLANALTQRLKRKVLLQCKVEETLIGGAIVRAGDWVIDGSVRGKLNRLLESL